MYSLSAAAPSALNTSTPGFKEAQQRWRYEIASVAYLKLQDEQACFLVCLISDCDLSAAPNVPENGQVTT